jgi:hypothetical protein
VTPLTPERIDALAVKHMGLEPCVGPQRPSWYVDGSVLDKQAVSDFAAALLAEAAGNEIAERMPAPDVAS